MPAPTLSEYKSPLYMIELQIAFMYMSKKDAREWLKSPQGIGYKNWMLRGAPENEIEGELNGNA